MFLQIYALFGVSTTHLTHNGHCIPEKTSFEYYRLTTHSKKSSQWCMQPRFSAVQLSSQNRCEKSTVTLRKKYNNRKSGGEKKGFLPSTPFRQSLSLDCDKLMDPLDHLLSSQERVFDQKTQQVQIMEWIGHIMDITHPAKDANWHRSLQ